MRLNIDGNSYLKSNSLVVGINVDVYILESEIVLTSATADGTPVCTAVLEYVGPGAKAREVTRKVKRPGLLRTISQSLLKFADSMQQQYAAAPVVEWIPTPEQVAECGNRHLVERGLVHMIELSGCSTLVFHGEHSGQNKILGPNKRQNSIIPLVLDLGDSATVISHHVRLPTLYVQTEGCSTVHLCDSSVRPGTILVAHMDTAIRVDAASVRKTPGGPPRVQIVHDDTAEVSVNGHSAVFATQLLSTPAGRKQHNRFIKASKTARGLSRGAVGRRRPTQSGRKRRRSSDSGPAPRVSKRRKTHGAIKHRNDVAV